MAEQEQVIKATLHGKEIDKFEAVKKDLGLVNDSEVIRILVTNEYKKLKGA